MSSCGISTAIQFCTAAAECTPRARKIAILLIDAAAIDMELRLAIVIGKLRTLRTSVGDVAILQARLEKAESQVCAFENRSGSIQRIERECHIVLIVTIPSILVASITFQGLFFIEAFARTPFRINTGVYAPALVVHFGIEAEPELFLPPSS